MFVIDCDLDTTQHIPCLLEKRVDVVFRYYARAKQKGFEEKIMGPDEAVALSRNKIAIAVVYQYNARSPDKFNYDQGASDGRLAREYAATTIGQPDGSAIYFGVDYDPEPADIGTNIVPHFKGLATAMKEHRPFAATYRIGVYGGWNVCDHLDREGLVALKWLSQSTGFGGRTERQAYIDRKAPHLVQGPVVHNLCAGDKFEHDENTVREGLQDIGQFVIAD